MSCPVCFVSISSLWGNKSGFSIYKCLHCDHIYVDLSSFDVDFSNEDSFRAYMSNQSMNSDLDYYKHLCSS